MMKTRMIATVFLLFACAFSANAQSMDASDDAMYVLGGSHGLEIQLGLLGSVNASADVSVGGVSTSSTASGFLGGLQYSYWVKDQLAVIFSVGVTDASAKTSTSIGGVYVESGAIVPVLFGVKYQPFEMTGDNVLRPYVLAAVGPTFGHATNVYTGTSVSTGTVSETVLGSRFAVALDLSVSRSLIVGAGVGYRWVSKFKNRIGSETDYSGADFLLSFGVLFGGH